VKQTAIQVSAHRQGVSVAINRFLAEHPSHKVVGVYPVEVYKIGGADTEVVVIFEAPEEK
jgi:hypothetical protein